MRNQHIIATPPGVTIREQLAIQSLEANEFASLMDLSEKSLDELMIGESHLTADIAFKLENVLGIPSQFWLNLETIYRNKLLITESETVSVN